MDLKHDTYAQAMSLALREARLAAQHDDVPVGAVVLNAAGDVVASAHNRRELDGDPTAHAEILALREAALRGGKWRLDDCTLVVTLEPCLMCAGAVLASRIGRIVIGAWDSKAGATGSQWDVVRDARIGSKVEVISGVYEEQCAGVLAQFFGQRR